MKETCERVQFKLTHPLGDRDSRREELMNQRKKEFGEKADARHKARAAAKDGDASDKVIRPLLLGANIFHLPATWRAPRPAPLLLSSIRGGLKIVLHA